MAVRIVEQTRQALEQGRIVVGDQLPAPREVVSTTGINPNTVSKAYREFGAARPGRWAGRDRHFVTADLARLRSDLASPLTAVGLFLNPVVSAG